MFVPPKFICKVAGRSLSPGAFTTFSGSSSMDRQNSLDFAPKVVHSPLNHAFVTERAGIDEPG